MKRYSALFRDAGVRRDVQIDTRNFGAVRLWPMAIVLSVCLVLTIELVVRAVIGVGTRTEISRP